MSKSVVVTGGAGFIGSNLTKELVKRGYKVKVIDNLLTGHKENLDEVIDQIEFVKGDIRDLDMLKRELKGVDVIFHQAALPSVPRSIDDPITSNDHNIVGTLHLLVAARDSGVKRVTFAASSSAYGDVDAEFKHEELPSNPLSPYALTKHTGENYCKMFHKFYGVETVCLRYFNVFGPHQDPNGHYSAVIPKFIKLMLNGESPTIYGDGEHSRDFTFVANNVEANILAAESDQGAGEVINIACGESTSLNDLVKMINEELGTDIKPKYEPAKVGDVKHSKASIEKAKRLIGYQPVKTFKEGLKETVQWYKNQAKKHQ